MSKSSPLSIAIQIGLRYTRAKRRNGFIAFVSLFALGGMALGVFSLIVVLSVMNGWDRELKDRTLRVIPHAILSTKKPLTDWQPLYNQIRDTEGLIAAAPYIAGKALLSRGDRVKPVEIQGIEPAYEENISPIKEYMRSGTLTALQPGEYGIVLGDLVAAHLGLRMGDHVTLTLPEVSITPAGIFPRSKRFKLIGVFSVGGQVDQYLGLIHIGDAQKLYRRANTIDGLHLKFDDIYRAPAAVKQLQTQLGAGVVVKDWSQTQGSLFAAVKMEKTVVGILLSIIIAVAALNIVTSLVMMVAEKRSDIAVLRTLGMTRWNIVSIFMVQGVFLGFVGIFIGCLLGVITAVWLPDIMAVLESSLGIQIFDPSVYFVAYLPSQWEPIDTLVVCAFSAVICFLATIYPAYRASTIEPAEALRYDT